MTRQTNYYNAAHYLHNSLILCNNIGEIDGSIYENMRFPTYDEENEAEVEIYQWFLTSASESDVEWLEKSFGLLFTYSEKLDLFVLCVDHLGTMWDSVPCDCYNDDIPDSLLNRTSNDF